ADKAFVLIEGNYFDSTTNPSLHDSTTSGGTSFVPTSSNQALCQTYLGRKCVENVLENSGALTGVSESTAIARLKGLTSGYTPVDFVELWYAAL
ncbi:hypothetical protein Gpo141_00013559, partial [Globisporangium polare]